MFTWNIRALLLVAIGSMVAAQCPLRTYSGSNFIGRTARVHRDFVGDMIDMNDYASSCGVKIYVTSSFRPTPVTGNAWNARKSNHMTGHAIDMNLQTGTKHCNSSCLRRYSRFNGPDNAINCFLRKIRYNHPVLHWGIDFNDPVHIDDRLNKRNPTEWDRIFADIRSKC